MSVPVRITPAARSDLLRAEEYFDNVRAGLGDEFIDEAFATFDRIGDMPLAYGEVDHGVRAVGVRRFGYIVYYRSDGLSAEVLAVLHGSRSPETWQSRT